MPETTAPESEKVMIEKISKVLNVEYAPPLSPSEVKRLYKALPGYQAITNDTACLAERYARVLNLAPTVLADLNQGAADVHRLEPAERVLEKLYLSVYHQRLQATSRCVGGMHDTARRIRGFAEAYPEVAEKGKFLLDFMKAFKPGRRKEKKRPEAGGAQAPSNAAA